MKLLLPGFLLTLLFLLIVTGGDPKEHVARYLALFGLAFGAYLFALARASAGLSPRALRGALLLAVLFRLAFLFGPPLLSDDIYRYVWEGRIQLHGGNPYAFPDRPEAPRFAGLRDPIFDKVNHPEFAAIYPPFFELAARAVVSISDSVLAMKVFLFACELLAWVLLSSLLPMERKARLLLWAWSPLAVTEIAGSGHNEALGMLLLVLSLALLRAGRPTLSALAGALAFQAKLLPGIVCLSWARRYRLRSGLLALLLACALVLPYRSAGSDLYRSLLAYGQRWRFNETAFAGLEFYLGRSTAPRASVALLAFVALALGFRGRAPEKGGLLVTAAFILLAPSVLPWYALWLLPFLVLEESLGALLFTGTVALAYWVYPTWQSTGEWQVPWSLRALEYLPPLSVAALELWRGKASSLN
jgi:hypothetical protein